MITVDPRSPAALLAASEGCPSVCWCLDCAPRKVEARLREAAATALRRDPRDVGALVYRSTLHGVSGWRASVSTRDGRVYARAWARRPDDAAAALLAVLRGGG